MSGVLFAEDGPRVFTTAPGAPFAEAVAKGLIARADAASGDPLALADVALIASTRRSIRALRSAFARCAQGVSITPRMTSLADLDAELVGLTSAIPPAIDPLRRQLLLARLVRAALLANPSLGAPCVAPKLAADLAALLDDCHGADVPIESLATLPPEKHAAHWALSQQFLGIITTVWPQILAEEQGAPIDPADRRRRQAEALIAAWEASPPQGPIVVAGSPTDAAAASLLAAVARLPQGAVVLPGYDRGLDDSATEALLSGRAPEHPQTALARLIDDLGLDPSSGGSVRLWGGHAGDLAEARARQKLLAQAMRPAPATDAWRAAAEELQGDAEKATANLTLLEAASSREEAAVIALAMREALETPGRSAALITPDRNLSRRVAAELARWGVKPDDSSGRPLALTPPGVYFRSVLDCAMSDCAPAELLALLKHPICAAGFPRGLHLRLTRRLEREALRAGGAPMQGATGIAERLRILAEQSLDDEDAPEIVADGDQTTREETPAPDALGLGPDSPGDAPSPAEWFGAVAAQLEAFSALLREEDVALQDLLEAHQAAALSLSQQLSADGETKPELFEKIAGETLRRFLERLIGQADAFGAIAPGDYPALLSQLIGQEAVREPFGRHPRALILGALEARMQSADLVILAGLNEGVWPKPPQPDPWLSRDMRRSLGLPPLEARIGLSAHDFFLAASAPEVILSRTRKTDGAPTTPSRWLLRLTNLLGGVAESSLTEMRKRGERLQSRLTLLDAGPTGASRSEPAPRPRPRPPLDARPRRFSVTEVETLIRDPYAIYAKKTLRLRAVGDLAPEPDQRDRGQLLHAVMEQYAREALATPPAGPEAANALYDRVCEEALAPYAPWPTLHAFWRARLSQIRDWFLDGEAERTGEGAPAALETVGALRFETALGEAWLTAKADRIDRLDAGGYAIYDYKAGKPPTEAERAVFAKQLPLEAAILAAEGFEGAPPGRVDKLAYLSLGGGDLGGQEMVLCEAEPKVLAEDALQGLIKLLGGYANPDQAYAARSRPQHIAFEGDFDHLSRLGEWRPEKGGAAEANQRKGGAS